MVPPLEGGWWQNGVAGIDYAHKENFQWISVIRLPDFVTKADFDWAVREAAAKKKQDFSKVEFFTYDEGLCVQCMHIGAYDDEPATVEAMHRFMEEQGYVYDMGLITESSQKNQHSPLTSANISVITQIEQRKRKEKEMDRYSGFFPIIPSSG